MHTRHHHSQTLSLPIQITTNAGDSELCADRPSLHPTEPKLSAVVERVVRSHFDGSCHGPAATPANLNDHLSEFLSEVTLASCTTAAKQCALAQRAQASKALYSASPRTAGFWDSPPVRSEMRRRRRPGSSEPLHAQGKRLERGGGCIALSCNCRNFSSTPLSETTNSSTTSNLMLPSSAYKQECVSLKHFWQAPCSPDTSCPELRLRTCPAC